MLGRSRVSGQRVAVPEGERGLSGKLEASCRGCQWHRHQIASFQGVAKAVSASCLLLPCQRQPVQLPEVLVLVDHEALHARTDLRWPGQLVRLLALEDAEQPWLPSGMSYMQHL